MQPKNKHRMAMPPCQPFIRHRALALLVGALFCQSASAALSDTVHPFVVLGYSYDDNLLRLPDVAPGFTGSRSDTIRQTLAGVDFERPFGRQVLTAEAKVSRVTFSNYSQLDYNGKDFSAAWKWHFLRDLDGHIGGSYSQTLTPFTDFHSSELNLRTTRHSYADATWRIHPNWQVRGGVTRDQYRYDLSAQRFNDRNEDLAEAGVDYLVASGSRIGLVARRWKGSYLNQRSFGGVVLDNGYVQDEFKANIYWALSGVTQVQALVGWAKRKHNFFAERDSSGANGRVTMVWKPLGEVKFTLVGWRDYAAVESLYVSNSLNKGQSIAAAWDFSSKIRVDASVRHEKRNFGEASGVVLPAGASDSGHNASLGVTYAPAQFVQLGLTATHDARSGSPVVGTGSYKANGLSFNVTGQF